MHQRQIICIGFILSLLSQHSWAETQKVISSDFLGKPGVELESPTPAGTPKDSTFKSKNQNRTRSILDEKKLDRAALKQSAETISSLSLLLRKLPPGPSRNQMLLNHAVALNLYAKELILSSKGPAITDDIKRYLTASLKDSAEVLSSPVKTQDQTSKAYDVKGSSLLYLDDQVGAMAAFNEVLKLNPPKERAGRIGLLVAEDHFEKGRYQEAANYYQTYFSRMTPQWQELANYKLGWCMINLDKVDLAEKYLAKVARSQSISGVGKDAMRDLAYLVTHKSDVMGSIKHAEMDLILPNDRALFLSEVRPNLEAAGLAAQHGIIVERLLSLEKNPEKRVDYLIANLRVQRKLSASRAHREAFIKLGGTLSRLNPKDFTAIFTKFESAIENETQAIMRTYIDTFAGRVKTNEPITQIELGQALKDQFGFYHRFFNKKKNYPAVVNLWSDVCLEIKDWACVDQVSDIIIIGQKNLAPMTERAYLDQITAIGQFLIQTANTPPAKKWSEKRTKRLQEFLQKFPKSAQWVPVAKLYTQNEMDQGHEKIALPYLLEIMARAPSEDQFYRLQFARFRLQAFDQVLSDTRGGPYIKDGSKVIELYRESALQLALKAKDKKDLDHYRSNLNLFISYCSEQSKITIARLDFFRYLIKEKIYPEAMQGLLTLPAPEINLPEYEPLRTEIWKLLVDQGDFAQAATFATQVSQLKNNAEWQQRRLLSTLFKGGTFTQSDFASLKTAEKEYFLGLFALASPRTLVEYAKSSRNLSDSERSILILSLKLSLDQRQLVRTSELESLLGKNYPFVEQVSDKPVSIEANINSITFPDLAKLSPQKQASVVQGNMEKARSIRTQISKAIKGKPHETSIRILTSARDLETHVAEMILNSPIPKEITQAQVEEYKSGLKSAADEFKQQATQFDTLIKGISGEAQKVAKAYEDRVLPAPDMSDWSWPSIYKSKLQNLTRELNSGNQLGALALLDYLRPSLIKEDSDFFMIRSGILLFLNPNAALRVYVLDELEKSGQKKIISDWEKLVNHPSQETPKK